MTVERMTAAHVKAVAELEKRCFTDAWSERSIASELSNPLSLWLVALDGDTVVGYVGSQSVLGEGDMLNLAVAPEARRRGIASALVEALIKALRAQGVNQLTLEVRASNEGARALYAKLGFGLVGRRPGYYFHPREDALLLRKEWET